MTTQVNQHPPAHDALWKCGEEALCLCIPVSWVSEVVNYLIIIHMHWGRLLMWSLGNSGAVHPQVSANVDPTRVLLELEDYILGHFLL